MNKQVVMLVCYYPKTYMQLALGALITPSEQNDGNKIRSQLNSAM